MNIVKANFMIPEIIFQTLPPRMVDANKADFGHVLVIGGVQGMMGAARLAGEAALRVGAGLVSIATDPQHASMLGIGCPELMVHAISQDTSTILQHLFTRATMIILGPGLGQHAWSEWLYQQALLSNKALLVDADGLNYLSKQPSKRNNWILTPHPGEAARLLQTTPQEVQQHRETIIHALQERYGGVVVLKGANSLVTDGNRISRCSKGNPGMASGGMGDLLSGVIAGLVAQGMSLSEAAEQGVLIHAWAGDLAAQDAGQRGMLASDLLSYIRAIINNKQ